MKRIVLAPILAILFAAGTQTFAEALEPPDLTRTHDDERLVLRLRPRTPEQTLAFYSARGFPPPMLELIRTRCFVTVGVRNKGPEILWLEPAHWTFSSNDKAIARFDRSWWNEQWQALDAPLPSRSTFRWTLLPESLDLRVDEAEGGNITLPRVPGPIRLEARFRLGEEGSGNEVTVLIEDLRCAPEAAE